jgi:hypothetical protein
MLQQAIYYQRKVDVSQIEPSEMVQIDIRGNKSLRPSAATLLAERLQSTFSWNEVVPTIEVKMSAKLGIYRGRPVHC